MTTTRTLTAGLGLTFTDNPTGGTLNLSVDLAALASLFPHGIADGASTMVMQLGASAVARDLQSIYRQVACTPEDFLAAGESITTDAGPAIRRAIASGRPIRLTSAYVVDVDPASAFNDSGTTRYGYSLLFPSNQVLICEDGSSITQKSGAQKWTRTVSFAGATGVKVFGCLVVDGNVSSVGAVTNEHQHGVFLYNTSDSYFERIDSRNARGDNVFIGGDNETTKSTNVFIGSLRCVKAGRKNLVLQQFDGIHIGVADLDNSTGGASIYAGGVPDTTDRHSLDLEPDTSTGAAWMRAWIGRLKTYGTGNDFSSGLTDAAARKVVLNIGDFEHTHISSATVPAWQQNGATLHIGNLRMTGLAGIAASLVWNYAAYISVYGRAYIEGSVPAVSDQLILLAANTTNRARSEFNALHLVNTVGIGIENRDADLRICKARFETAGVALWNRGLSSTATVNCDCRIDEIELADVGQPTGAGYAILHSSTGTQLALLSIGRIRFSDSRSPKLNYIVSCGSGAAAGLSLGQFDNATAVVPVQFSGTDKFFRQTGGGGFPAAYVGTGTPEAMVTAPVGSTFMRTDGGAGTSFYVKQTGTGNTGWVGK